MESPRSSLLSTLVMTLPLVVVPAIALLRPPAPGTGTSATELAADEADDFFAELEQFGDSTPPATGNAAAPGTSADSEFDAWFEEKPQQESPDVSPGSHGAAADDPFLPGGPPSTETSPSGRARSTSPQRGMPGSGTSRDAGAPTADPEAEVHLLQQLHALGVTRTLWFTAGSAGTGFAAFVPGENPSVVYRFEAVGSGREQVLQNVLGQLARWTQQQTQSGNPR